MFSSLLIETTNTCNRKCNFCKHSYHSAKSEQLSEDTYRSILTQLADMDYDGRISPFGINEPLLDTRLARFVRLTSETVPRAFISIVTNGDHLTYNTLHNLRRVGLHSLGISIYDDNSWRYHSSTTYPDWVVLLDMRKATMENRAGNLRHISTITPIAPCYRPSEQMFIRADGTVPLCCSDFHAEVNLGNVKNDALLDIWFNPLFVSYRKELVLNRTGLHPCQDCSFNGGVSGRNYPANLRQLPVTNYDRQNNSGYSKEYSTESRDT